MYPNNSHLSGLHTVASVSSSLDTKPLHLDAKSLLNHGVTTTSATNNNSTTVALETKKWTFFFPYMLLQKHAIILCHLIAITILKIESKFEYYQAGLESHLDQLAEVFTKEKETII